MENLELFDPEKQVKELKRTCSDCGKTWHVLDSREKELEKRAINAASDCDSGMQECSFCNKLLKLPQRPQKDKSAPTTTEELISLRICPECYCSNFSEEVIIHEKQ